MNADDRTNPSNARVFAPVAEDADNQAPVTGGIPTRTSMRPTSSAQATTSRVSPPGAPVTTGEHPTAPMPTQGASAFATGAAGAAGAVGAGVGKIKGYAVKAKDSLTEGDDVTAARGKGGPRKARVLLSRIDPWSALKMGFLLSVALGIMMVIAVFVLWSALNNQGVFTMINDWIKDLFTAGEVDLLQFTSLSKVMSATILLAIINVVLLTALTTIGAFLYNIVSSVVGGVYVTLTDD